MQCNSQQGGQVTPETQNGAALKPQSNKAELLTGTKEPNTQKAVFQTIFMSLLNGVRSSNPPEVLQTSGQLTLTA